MDKYTKAVLTVIALSVLALPVKAEEMVYYCEMVSIAETSSHFPGIRKPDIERFKLKVDGEKAVFGAGGFFDRLEIPIIDPYWKDEWIARDKHDILYFYIGRLHYASADHELSQAVAAKCEEF